MARNGFTPARKIGSNYNSGGLTQYTVANNYATAIFKGDPVELSAGTVGVADAQNAIGVARGFAYVDATGKPVFSDYLPAGTSSAGPLFGETSPVVLVEDDPKSTFIIPSDATVSAGDVGLNFNVSIGTGNTQTGISNARLHVSSRSAASTDRLVKVVGLYKVPGNSYGAASNTLLEVRFLNHQNG